MDTFYMRMAECLEVGEVSPADVLRDFEAWDSLTALSILSMVLKEFKVTISAEEMRGSVTVGDLWGVVSGKMAG